MLEMLNKWFTKPTGSKETAKARLRFLLVHDQVDLTPSQIESMKTEIMEVISRYVEVDQSCADFRLQKEAGGIALVSNIPVSRVTARAV
jgi:cell division topological specificity factor